MIGFALALASLAPSQPGGIPVVCQGHWTTDLSACGSEDTNGVDIEPQAVTFYEARGTVLHASEGAKGASARVSFVGEGRSWEERIRLRILPEDRLELRALGRTQTFQHCPMSDT